MSAKRDHRCEFEVFFDGDCPLCMREIAFLRRRDHERRIRFTDITAPGFRPEHEVGRDMATLMGRIHGRLPDGTVVEGIEVFRRLYAAIGMRRLVSVSRLPVVSQLASLTYSLFARHRLRLTGRCESGACEVPTAAMPGLERDRG